MVLFLEKGDVVDRQEVLLKLVGLQYVRDDIDFRTGTFRVRGDVIEVCPASEDIRSVRIEFFGDEVEGIFEIDRLTGAVKRKLDNVCIYPASHYVTDKDSLKSANRNHQS